MLREGFACIESNVERKILVDSESFLSQNTGIDVCHDVNISEIEVVFDVLKLTF